MDGGFEESDSDSMAQALTLSVDLKAAPDAIAVTLSPDKFSCV